MRYWHCAVCGYFKTRVVMGEPYLAPWHEHGRRGRVSILQLRPEEFYGHAESVHAPTFGNPYEFEESQMKTCETCKGTGQVVEVPKGGDIVEVMFGRNAGLLGLVVGQQTKGLYDIGKGMGNQIMVLALKSGESYSLDPNAIKIRHGHIHIDR